MSDIWLVQLPTGERRMTLDELDAAYQAEHIDDRTLVREPGTPWRTLGSLLGIETHTQTHQSVRPVSIDLETELPQSKSRRNVIIFGMPAAALVACGALLAITKLGAATPPAPAAAAVMVAPTIAPTIAAAPPPPIVVADKPVLTDVQKQALTKADQDREKKVQKSKETKKKPAPAPKAKPVFTKSGNKYDPLNAKL